MNSVVSLRTFANTSNVPIVVFADMQQEYVAAPRFPAISGIERSQDNCRKALDHAHRTGESSPPPALIDTFHRKLKVTCPCNVSAGHALEDVSTNEIHRAVSKPSGLYGDALETDDLIASSLPRKLEIGKNAGG